MPEADIPANKPTINLSIRQHEWTWFWTSLHILCKLPLAMGPAVEDPPEAEGSSRLLMTATWVGGKKKPDRSTALVALEREKKIGWLRDGVDHIFQPRSELLRDQTIRRAMSEHRHWHSGCTAYSYYYYYSVFRSLFITVGSNLCTPILNILTLPLAIFLPNAVYRVCFPWTVRSTPGWGLLDWW